MVDPLDAAERQALETMEGLLALVATKQNTSQVMVISRALAVVRDSLETISKLRESRARVESG